MEKFKINTKILVDVVWENPLETADDHIARREFEQKVEAVAGFMNGKLGEAITKGAKQL